MNLQSYLLQKSNKNYKRYSTLVDVQTQANKFVRKTLRTRGNKIGAIKCSRSNVQDSPPTPTMVITFILCKTKIPNNNKFCKCHFKLQTEQKPVVIIM